MINFPDTPSLGQSFTAAGITWTWDGAKWLAASANGTLYAPLVSPVFTGDPKAPTPATADNDTSIATSAFVKAQSYLSGNQTITLSGAVSGSGATAITTTLATVPIASGGTGQTTAPAALTALGAVPLAGGTMTGNLVIQPASGGAQLELHRAAGNSALLAGYTGANPRWTIVPGDAAAEGGANAGSNFTIGRWGDAGAFIDTPLSINRATGNATFGGTVTAAGGTMTGALSITNQVVGLLVSNATDCFMRFSGVRQWTLGPEGSAGTFWIFDTTAGAIRIAVTSTGACSNATGTWTAISDGSLKEDVAPYTRGLEAIRELNPVSFRYQAGTPFGYQDRPSDLRIGLIADEVEPYVPEIVGEMQVKLREADATVATLDNGNLIFALINAVKTLAAEIDQLKAAGTAP